ncbi:MAG TPA: sulfite oxidase [Pirellulales bacterium]|nr:sulfite oxidase [Pirellulales bacterium]
MSTHRKIVTVEPENSETPLDAQSSWVTPNRLFFIRNHFPRPQIDLDTWRLSVEGCVRRPRQWTWDELNELPQRTVFATVECAGNGRSFLRPREAGVQWAAGAVGHAEWTGVPLRDVLEQAGVGPGAMEVLCQGADRGTEPDHPQPMHFERGLPMQKALHPDTLLALRMNGEVLEPDHGFPLRLFVPGWYGVASVKWLERIEVLDRRFGGYFQTTKYSVKQRRGDALETVVVGPMAAKSEILRPRQGDVLPLGANRVVGLAWAGEDAVARVEISTNDGRDWRSAELIGPRAAYSWILWETTWQVEVPGDYVLKTRAVGESGETQPADHDPLRGGYLITFSRPVTVHVEAAVGAEEQATDWQTLLYDMNAFAERNARRPLDVDLECTAGAGI